MHSRFFNPAIASWAIASAAVLAFLGCEWGGSHENTWNDGYSWANFTGTYRFVNAVYYMPTATATIPMATSARVGSAMDFAKDETTATFPIYDGWANDSMHTATSAGGSIAVVNGLVPGSLSITVQTSAGTVTISSDSSNNLYFKGKSVGTVTSAGAWNFTLPITAVAKKGDKIGLTYKYYGKAGGGGSSSSGGSSGGSGSSSGGGSSSSSGGSSSSSSSSSSSTTMR
jgi:uncharacterized membrane protein YgcG